jgi:hypothetical protein
MGLDCQPDISEGSGGGGKTSPLNVNPRGEDDEEDDEDGEEREVSPPPHSLSREVVPLLGDIFIRQAGITVGTRRPKQPQTKTGLSTTSPP